MSGDGLSRYLGSVVRRRFAFGKMDCCILMADWLVCCGLPDAMADRRGAYASWREYRALMRREGGIVASCKRRFGAVGLEERDAPARGDVCLVRAPIVLGRRVLWVPTGAICLSPGMSVVVTPDAGLMGAPMTVLHAWGLPDA